MKTATTLLLGFFCLLASESCRCDPADDETKNKYNSSSAGKNAKNGNQTENDSISLNQ